MAETYNIYDIYQYMPTYIATLAAGLRDNSRIAQAASGTQLDHQGLLIAQIASMMSQVIHKEPVDYLEIFTINNKEDEHEDEIIAFDTPEQFIEARNRILGGGGK